MIRRLATAILPRRLLAPRLPQAVIIGAQKSGTTALAAYLNQHPRLYCAGEKEVDFFGSDRRYSLGLRWYANQWPSKLPADAIRFEASPQYMMSPAAAGRLRQRLPEVRLIAILRDPAWRAFSAWRMYRQQLAADPQFYRKWITARYSEAEDLALVRRTEAELNDFWLAIRREAECLERGQSMEWKVLELGLYGPQLARFAELYPREQLLILEGDDLRFRRVATLDRVLHFLGLDSWDWSQADLSEVFVGSVPGAIPQRTRDFLREFYADSNRMLEGLVNPLPRWAHEPRKRRAA